MRFRLRRVVAGVISFAILGVIIYQTIPRTTPAVQQPSGGELASTVLQQLPIKGRAPKTGYTRAQFGDGWAVTNGCSTRDIILNRDLQDVVTNSKCQVVKGALHDPYTGKTIPFERGGTTSAAVQIDHVVALGDAWQTGAQQLTAAVRQQLANDPLELLAVDGPSNQQKSDADAASWLPPNKGFRCEYVARQIAIKRKYQLWVTLGEHEAMAAVLKPCPGQSVPD